MAEIYDSFFQSVALRYLIKNPLSGIFILPFLNRENILRLETHLVLFKPDAGYLKVSSDTIKYTTTFHLKNKPLHIKLPLPTLHHHTAQGHDQVLHTLHDQDYLHDHANHAPTPQCQALRNIHYHCAAYGSQEYWKYDLREKLLH